MRVDILHDRTGNHQNSRMAADALAFWLPCSAAYYLHGWLSIPRSSKAIKATRSEWGEIRTSEWVGSQWAESQWVGSKWAAEQGFGNRNEVVARTYCYGAATSASGVMRSGCMQAWYSTYRRATTTTTSNAEISTSSAETFRSSVQTSRSSAQTFRSSAQIELTKKKPKLMLGMVSLR